MPHSFRPRLSHLGIFARDVELLEKFYTEVFGLIVTDRGVGSHFKNTLVFLSGNAQQHHQLVLASGRAEGAPSTVMQISFMVDSLDDLRTARERATARGVRDILGMNHGNAWSIYFDDPEGNKIEVYMDTPFHTPQPMAGPLELELPESELLSRTEALVKERSGSMARADFVASMEAQLTER